MAREDFRYKSEFRVRFGETDLQGIVFNANYLLYTDTTQLDYFRRIGVPYNEVRRQGHDIYLVDTRLQFHAPARFDEVIESFTRISGFGNSSLQMDFEMYEKESGRHLATCLATYVIVDEKTGRPLRAPAYLRAAVRDFEDNSAIELE
jgi:acyl-CoA thioester hydrolase